MMNKQRKHLLDPFKINNYNKFLKTLDKDNIKDTNKLEEPTNNINEDSFKNEIDKIIENINNNFKINNYSSTNFTGQNINDLTSNYIEPNDPNKYIDYLNKKYNCKLYKHNINPSKNEIVVPIRENINIEAEINNISDLLELINRYQNDSSIKYNINIIFYSRFT